MSSAPPDFLFLTLFLDGNALKCIMSRTITDGFTVKKKHFEFVYEINVCQVIGEIIT